MNDAPHELTGQYRSALRDYVTGGGEGALQRAYDLGRRALDEGLGVLQMASLHHDAMQSVLPDTVGGVARTVKAAAVFFAESLSPFEMAHRGFREANAALHRLNQALEQETRRIAHALHDEAGQLLTSVHLALKDAGRDLPPAARKRLQEVRSLLDRIEDHLRRLSHELRPVILDDLGLIPALKFLAEGVSMRTGTLISVDASTDGRLPSLVEATLYRSVQEALTNVAKHARATRVAVHLQQEGREILCSIRDDGIGFDAPTVLARPGGGGLGLVGIRERIEALGGTHRIVSAPGRGTELAITIPLGELGCPSGFSSPTTTSLSARG